MNLHPGNNGCREHQTGERHLLKALTKRYSEPSQIFCCKCNTTNCGWLDGVAEKSKALST
jgi:hypothetical protein